MAKAEFGRNYVDDKQLEEVRRSVSRAKAQRAPAATVSKKKRKDRG